MTEKKQNNHDWNASGRDCTFQRDSTYPGSLPTQSQKQLPIKEPYFIILECHCWQFMAGNGQMVVGGDWVTEGISSPSGAVWRESES